jgi:hypothetical protein
MTVRIVTSIPAGEIEVIIPMDFTMAESGIRQLRAALLEGSNRILRAYGAEEILVNPMAGAGGGGPHEG